MTGPLKRKTDAEGTIVRRLVGEKDLATHGAVSLTEEGAKKERSDTLSLLSFFKI